MKRSDSYLRGGGGEERGGQLAPVFPLGPVPVSGRQRRRTASVGHVLGYRMLSLHKQHRRADSHIHIKASTVWNKPSSSVT